MYYVAFAKKNDKFYIISKDNDNIALSGVLEKYINTMDNYLGESLTKQLNEDGNYRNGYVEAFEFMFVGLTNKAMYLEKQTVEYDQGDNKIDLNEKNSKYIYKNKNYTMTIEPIYKEETEDEELNEYYDEDEKSYYLAPKGINCNVTITKSNGEKESSIVHLLKFDEESATLETFTNGYIGFESEDCTQNGWYDDNGNKYTISSDYNIIDIKDNKIIAQMTNSQEESLESNNYIMIDMSGRKLLETKALDIYDNFYLVKNADNKMVLMDENLKTISNEYDKIITNMRSDISAYYSFYF